LEKVTEFNKILQDKEGWSVTIDDKTKGSELFCEYKVSKRGNPVTRAKAYSDHDPLTTIRAAMDLKIRPAYDRNLTVYEMLGSLGCNLHMAYTQTERVAVIQPRDVYQITLLNALPDGSILLVTTEHPDVEKYPPRDGCVRMRLPCAGMWIKPDPQRPGKSVIHQIMEINPMTVLPEFI
jgi:hypothetical protein